MKEKILDILEKHYHGRNYIESRCADELLGLFNDVGQSEQFYCDERDKYGNTDCSQQCMACVRDEQSQQ